MFKLTVIFVTIIFCQVHSAPEVLPDVPIVAKSFTIEDSGKYQYSYETGDGIKAHSEGDLKEVDKTVVGTVKGGFEYTNPEGEVVSISYTADETGYHPIGDSIPAVPAHVMKLVKFFEAHPELSETSVESTK